MMLASLLLATVLVGTQDDPGLSPELERALGGVSQHGFAAGQCFTHFSEVDQVRLLDGAAALEITRTQETPPPLDQVFHQGFANGRARTTPAPTPAHCAAIMIRAQEELTRHAAVLTAFEKGMAKPHRRRDDFADVNVMDAETYLPTSAAPPGSLSAEAPVLLETRPTWEIPPIGMWPDTAPKGVTSGEAVLHCSVLSTRFLADCRTVSEAPEGAGFGAASIAALRTAQIKPPVDGPIATHVQFTMRYRLE